MGWKAGKERPIIIPVQPEKNCASQFSFFIDEPRSWVQLPEGLVVRGWCFSASGDPITGVRLKSPQQISPGVTGLPRPDVAAAFGPIASLGSGFEIRAILQSGRHPVSIEVRDAAGSWRSIARFEANVKSRWLPKWLGGASSVELIDFQMPGHAMHSPRRLARERLPRPDDTSLRLSVVTPSYQQARFLEETIGSVLHAAPAGLRYVVQDGGSTDGSTEIIARWARNYPEVGDRRREAEMRSAKGGEQRVESARMTWESAPDRGQADAIAKGFAKTSGGPDDIMAWINSDDFYLPGALHFVTGYFARHPDVDVVYGHRILVDENSHEVGRWFLPRHDPEVLRLNDFVPQETLFWRRRIWNKVGGIDTSFKFAMDWDLLLRFQAAGAKIVRVPYFLACFRVHAAQKTSARMHDVGQREIDLLRTRTHGRAISPAELESNPRLIRYLRRSAFIEFLWKLGLRAP